MRIPNKCSVFNEDRGAVSSIHAGEMKCIF